MLPSLIRFGPNLAHAMYRPPVLQPGVPILDEEDEANEANSPSGYRILWAALAAMSKAPCCTPIRVWTCNRGPALPGEIGRVSCIHYWREDVNSDRCEPAPGPHWMATLPWMAGKECL